MRAAGWGRRAVAVLITMALGVALVVTSRWAGADARIVLPSQGTPTGPLIKTADIPVFSPNNDGRQDRGRIGFKLSEPARVTVIVRNWQRTVVRRARLGRLEGGHHEWTWDGRTDNDKPVHDNWYMVTLRAAAATHTDSAQTSALVDTELRGELVTTRSTVYPRASAVEDHVQLVWLFARWSPEGRDLANDVLAKATLEIRTRTGDLVWHRTVRDTYTPTFDWSARSHGGRALPTGRYVAQVTVTDSAGNRRHAEKNVRVSHAQLVEDLWTSTMAAAKAGRANYYAGDPHCLGCYDICPPVASERFPDGLSFRPCEYGWAQRAFFGIDLPFTAAPVDSFRVTASGGPTTPGSGDVGYLDGIPVGPGDASATTPWSAVDLVREPFLPDRNRPVHWGFATPSGSYDVATFTLEYRHYVPAD